MTVDTGGKYIFSMIKEYANTWKRSFG
jgi:hypothetical protein